MSVLVFLEHHGSELQKGALGVLSKAATLGPVDAVLVGGGVKALASEAGRFGAAKVHVAEDAALEPPLPQARVDVIAKVVREPASPASPASTAMSSSESVSCGFFFAPMIPFSDG